MLPRIGVWLTTVSTVVAIATGMFTLRDSIWRPEPEARPPRAAPVSTPSLITSNQEAEFKQAATKVCERLNKDERARLRDMRRLKARLEHVTTGLDQADELLLVVNRMKDRSMRALASFEGSDAPKRLAAVRSRVASAWRANLGVLKTYARGLDRATSYGDLLVAARRNGSRQDATDENWETVATGLASLGGPPCEDPTKLTAPPIRIKGPAAESGSSGSGLSASAAKKAPLTQPVDHSSPPPWRFRFAPTTPYSDQGPGNGGVGEDPTPTPTTPAPTPTPTPSASPTVTPTPDHTPTPTVTP